MLVFVLLLHRTRDRHHAARSAGVRAAAGARRRASGASRRARPRRRSQSRRADRARRSRRGSTSLIPSQPDRGGGERRDGAAHPLHAPPRAGDRAQPRREPRDARRILPGARRRDADARALGGAGGADRRLRARAAARRARAARRWRARSVSTSSRTRVGQSRRHSAPLSGGRGLRRDPDAPLRARRAARAAHRVQLELVDRVAAGAGRERRAADSGSRAA